MNILFGGNRKWQNHYLRKWMANMYSLIRRGRTADRHMGATASGLSEAVPQGYIHQSSYKRQVERLPCRHRQAGAGTL